MRISWDEATTLIADEITRVKDTYGLPSIFIQGDGHGETKVIHASHGANTRLMNLLGDDWTYQARQPDSWEGWYWGAKHMWGEDPLGQFEIGNLLLDIAENTVARHHGGPHAFCAPHAPWAPAPTHYTSVSSSSSAPATALRAGCRVASASKSFFARLRLPTGEAIR